jgi:hypothetical protein
MKSNELLNLPEFPIGFVDSLYFGNELGGLLLLFLTDEGLHVKLMHVVELDNISQFLLLLSHFIAEGHALNHIIGKHPVRDLYYLNCTFFFNP